MPVDAGPVRPSGILLAGGASRRMGVDKATLVVEGRRLVDRGIGRLAELCDDVVVASGNRRIPGVAVRQVLDATPGQGPMSGLVAGLLAVPGPLAIVLAVDMPNPDIGLLAALVDRWAGQTAIIPTVGGQLQPLHAVWATATGALLAARLDGGHRSLHGAVEAIRAEVLADAATATLATHSGWDHNLNSPSDLDPGRA